MLPAFRHHQSLSQQTTVKSLQQQTSRVACYPPHLQAPPSPLATPLCPKTRQPSLMAYAARICQPPLPPTALFTWRTTSVVRYAQGLCICYIQVMCQFSLPFCVRMLICGDSVLSKPGSSVDCNALCISLYSLAGASNDLPASVEGHVSTWHWGMISNAACCSSIQPSTTTNALSEWMSLADVHMQQQSPVLNVIQHHDTNFLLSSAGVLRSSCVPWHQHRIWR